MSIPGKTSSRRLLTRALPSDIEEVYRSHTAESPSLVVELVQGLSTPAFSRARYFFASEMSHILEFQAKPIAPSCRVANRESS